MYASRPRRLHEVEACCSAARPSRASPPPGPRRGRVRRQSNSMPKYVVSSSYRPGLEQHHRHRPRRCRRPKEGDGGPTRSPAAVLAQGLHRAGLVDQWNLMVFPVILGSGRRLFPADAEDKQKLRATVSRTYANGVQLQVFRRAYARTRTCSSSLVASGHDRTSTRRRRHRRGLGIGHATAAMFAEMGENVFGLDIRPTVPEGVTYVECNVGDRASWTPRSRPAPARAGSTCSPTSPGSCSSAASRRSPTPSGTACTTSTSRARSW